MRLLFKQRVFSWLDSYDVYDEQGAVVYTVRGELAWGHCLKIFDAGGRELGMLKERMLTFLPKFDIYTGAELVGEVKKEFTFFHPRFTVNYNGWTVDGNMFEWDYTVLDIMGLPVAEVSKQLFNWSDTYIIDVKDSSNALAVLMLVLAIDAEKCSRD